jgi:ribosome modulation factor
MDNIAAFPNCPRKVPATEFAEDDGFEAFVRGFQRFENPFHLGSECRAAWDSGWRQAEDYHGR